MKLMGFSIWKNVSRIQESLGDGSEIFQEQLDNIKRRNVYILSFPISYGEDYDTTSGSLKFKVQMDVKRSGIETIDIELEEMILEVVPIDENDEKKKEITLNFTKEILMKCETFVEIRNFPIYLEWLDVDMSNCEDSDGEVDLSKASISAVFGAEK
jgi:hypothetical protein